MKVSKATDPKFIQTYKTAEGYEYAERNGVHSVAFLLYDSGNETIGLNMEYKPPVNSWCLGAFGGSIDPKKSLVDIVLNEVLEETGHKADVSNVEYVGKYLVSTQMNQYCYLFSVAACQDEEVKKTTTDATEVRASIHWHHFTELPVLEDWKSVIIADAIKKRHFNNG
jgi:8-oxo-dGTP pyrophosphatase MutT (NUDIX family)